MPFESEKQRRFMYAAALGHAKKKDAPSPEEAKKFIADSHGEVKKPAHNTNETSINHVGEAKAVSAGKGLVKEQMQESDGKYGKKFKARAADEVAKLKILQKR